MRLRQLWIALALVAAACGGSNKKEDTTAAGSAAAAADTRSLYDRLGGKDAITLVVDDFVANVAADDKIKHFFANTDAKGLKAKLVDQICEASGGPCKYTGKDMKTAHTGMKVTEDDFNALVGDLVKALDQHKVAEGDKNELLGKLGPMKGDIVGR
jgi:hemoglobin